MLQPRFRRDPGVSCADEDHDLLKTFRALPLIGLLLIPSTLAQEPAPADTTPPTQQAASAAFDTSYRPSEVASARLLQQYLVDVRLRAGSEVRDRLNAAFAEKTPVELWLELVSADGLKANDVADALAAYWVLNWITANGAYALKIDHLPVRAQLAAAMSSDPSFRALTNRQRQEMAERYVLDFLVQHALLTDALARKDMGALLELSGAATARFRQELGVDLLALVPGPEGLVPVPARQQSTPQ